MIGALETKFQSNPVEVQTVAILSRISYLLGGEPMCGLLNSRSGVCVHGLQIKNVSGALKAKPPCLGKALNHKQGGPFVPLTLIGKFKVPFTEKFR
jgi:hypothetical protein